MDFGPFDHVDSIDPEPEATDLSLLPFVLYDSDRQHEARPVGYLPVVLPDEWLAALLFERTRPGQFTTRDSDGGRWQAVAEGLMHAAMTQVRALVADVRARADADIDAALWWQECREQVRRHLCPAADPDTPAPPPAPARPARLRLVPPPGTPDR